MSTKRRHRCANGCGRVTQSQIGVCCYCQGRAPNPTPLTGGRWTRRHDGVWIYRFDEEARAS